MKAEKQPRKVFPILTPAQHLKLGTGPHALMVCRDCGALGCLIPVPHGVKSLDKAVA